MRGGPDQEGIKSMVAKAPGKDPRVGSRENPSPGARPLGAFVRWWDPWYLATGPRCAQRTLPRPGSGSPAASGPRKPRISSRSCSAR